jgi:tryptophan synthase alpha chain
MDGKLFKPISFMSTSDRIAKLFSDCKAEHRAAFVAYVCACDPDFNRSLDVCKTLIDQGVDLLELGVPFSDPLADGLTNQLAAQRALESGCTQEDVFRLVMEIRKFSQIPIVFYTYYNLIFSQGVEEYVVKSKEAGVDGLLTLDLPPEEAGELLVACEKLEMANVFIIAPTTPEERISKIASKASGFLYYVSREGVTGERQDLAGDLSERVASIRQKTDLPLVVGFGISSPEQVSEVAKVADGVVVGSALVNCIPQNLDNHPAMLSAIKEKSQRLVGGLMVR